MNKKELIDKMVAKIMENFDFDFVHRVMVDLDWKHYNGNGELTVPSTYQLIKTAERILREAAQHYEEESYVCGTGGLMAHIDSKEFTLQFILTGYGGVILPESCERRNETETAP